MTATPESERRFVPRLDITDYQGQWLVLDPESYEVLGHGTSIEAAGRTAAEKGSSRPLLPPVPESGVYLLASP